MTLHSRILLPILLALAAAGCATPNTIVDAETLVAAGRYEEGLAELEAQARRGERLPEYRAAILRNRGIAAERLGREAQVALQADRLDQAEQIYRRVVSIEPDNEVARVGLRRLQSQREQAEQLAKADDLIRKNDLEGAERRLRSVLLEDPRQPKALALLAQIAERQRRVLPLAPVLGPEFKKLISLEFREANLKAVFEAIWNASGVNFILDRDVRNDAKVSIFVHEVSVEEAVDALLITQQLAKKVMSAKTLFIYPKTPQKVSEYQDLIVRNFFLGHADAKQMQGMLKTILKTKEVFIDEKRNLVVIRDSQEGVDLAEKLIKAHDQADPEVMLALDVIEIRRSKLSEIGLAFATPITFGVATPISLDALKSLTSVGINVGLSGPGGTGAGVLGALNLQKTDADTRLLANPRIRVRNREKAKIHIGDRLPVITTTSSATSTFVGQTVNYLDVGLKLEVEPQVMLDDDVIIKLNLEVSSATQSKVNTSFYDVGTRNTSTVLTIRDGETQVLAGLIRDDEAESGNRVPGLGDLPIVGRLFSSEKRSQDKTEIILAITPRILRNLVRPGADLAGYSSGSESGRFGFGAVISPVPRPPRPVIPARPVGPGVSAPGVPFPVLPGGAPLVTGPGVGGGVTALPATPGVVAAPAQVTPPVSTAPPATGVIPLIDFETPPGVGSTRGAQ